MSINRFSLISCKLLLITIIMLLLIIFSNNISKTKINYLKYTEEICRLTSPDSLVEAVILKKGGDITVGFSYQIYIVPTGEKPINKTHIFFADNVDSLNIIWKKPKLLEIKYKNSRISYFQNFWRHKSFNNYKYYVYIELRNIRD